MQPLTSFLQIGLIGAALLASGAVRLSAAEETPPAKSAEPTPPRTESKTDEALRKRLAPKSEIAPPKKQAPAETAPREEGNPLERVVAGMRSASERIGQQDTGEQTRAIQEQVIRDLDKLIEQAKQQQKNPPKSPPQSPPSPQDQQQQRQPMSDASEQQEQAGNANSQKDRQQPEDSTERADQGSDREQARQRQQRFSIDVWGHLPPKLREQLLNTYGDKVLPQYEDLVRRYYEALSEQGRPHPGSR